MHEITTPGDLIRLDTGRFVEFEAAIWKSGPEAFLSSVAEIAELELALDIIDQCLHEGNRMQDSQDLGNVQRQAKIATLEEAKVLSAAITRDNSQKLVAGVQGSQEKLLAVLTVEPEYFRIPTMSNIVGGTFPRVW